MKRTNLLISLLILAGVFLYITKSGKVNTDDINQELEIRKIATKINPDASTLSNTQPSTEEELPEDIRKAMIKPESNDPNELPDDLKAQLNAPPPELPEDLKKQLALPPQELPEDLKAQLNSPPPELPEDIKKALAIPPRVVTIEEVNNPNGLNAPADPEADTE